MAAVPEKPKFDPFAAAGNYASEADSSAPADTSIPAPGQADTSGPGYLSQLGHSLGLGTREVVQGMLSPTGNLIDLAARGMQPFGLPFKSSAQKTSEALTAMGLPEEQTSGEKIRGGIIEGGAAAIPMIAGGAALEAGSVPGSIGARVGQTLQANPIGQGVIGGIQGGTQGGLQAAGVNPYVAALGGMGAGVLAGTVSPNLSTGFANASDRALAQTAREKYGIPIDPASMAAPGVKQLFGLSKMLPFSGAAGDARATQDALNAAIGKTWGAVPVGGKLTPEAMTTARDATSGIYQNVAANSAPLLDVTTNKALTTARSEAAKLGDAGDPVIGIIDDIRDVAARNGGRIPSGWLVNALGSKSALSRGAGGSSAAKDFFGDVQAALQENLTRYATPDQQGMIAQANQNWKNMKTVEGLVAQGGGDIDPKKFAATFARNKYQRVAYTGGDPQLAELADISDRFLTPPSLAGQVGHYGAGGLAVGAEHLLEQGASLPHDPAALIGYGAKAAAVLGGNAGARALLRRGGMGTQAGALPPTLPETWARGLLAAPTGATALYNPQLNPVQFKQF